MSWAADRPSTAAANRRVSFPGWSMPARRSCDVACARASPTVGIRACPGSGIGALLHGGQLARLMLRDERVDQLVEPSALEHRFKVVQCQADAVIGDAPLWKIVGADALRAVARADLPLALGSTRIRRPLALLLVEAGAEHLHGQAPVLMLRFFRRYDDEAGRQMRDAHRGIRLVHVLAAGAAGPHSIDANVLGADFEVDVLHLRQDGDGGSGGVDAPARFGGRNALHAMHARLVLEPGEHTLAGDRGDDLLVAAKIVFREADDFRLPAMLLGIAAVHAEKVGREQCRFVAPGSRPDLQNRALLVGGVLGEEVNPQLLLEIRQARLEPCKLIARQRRKVLVGSRIGNQRCQVLTLALRLAQGLDGGDDRVQLGELLRQLNTGGLVDTLAKLGLDRLPALNELVELLGRYGGHL